MPSNGIGEIFLEAIAAHDAAIAEIQLRVLNAVCGKSFSPAKPPKLNAIIHKKRPQFLTDMRELAAVANRGKASKLPDEYRLYRDEAARLIRIAKAEDRPVRAAEACDLVRSSPILQRYESAIGDGGHNIWAASGTPPAIAIMAASVQELIELAREDTRENADLSRLIAAARTDPDSYEAVEALLDLDRDRPGERCRQLVAWESSPERLERPSRRSHAAPHLLFRDCVLAALMADVIGLGFPASQNTRRKGKKADGLDSAAEIVVNAVRAPLGVKSAERAWNEIGAYGSMQIWLREPFLAQG